MIFNFLIYLVIYYLLRCFICIFILYLIIWSSINFVFIVNLISYLWIYFILTPFFIYFLFIFYFFPHLLFIFLFFYFFIFFLELLDDKLATFFENSIEMSKKNHQKVFYRMQRLGTPVIINYDILYGKYLRKWLHYLL